MSGALARDPDRLRARARARAAADRRRTSPRSTARRCAAWTPRPRRRWCARSTRCARPTSRSAASSRCRRSGCVPGLGSHVSWEERLDGRLAMAICSIQAIKGASIGDAFTVAGLPGSQAHDEIFYSRRARLLPRDQPRRRPGGRHDQRLAADRARRDEAAADADQAAALGRHRDPRAGPGAARAHRLVHRARRRAWSARRWSRWCSPTPTGASSAATTSTTCCEAVGAYDRPDRMAFVLIGFMGAGKSTAAGELADALGSAALDSDALLEERFGHPVAREFELHGEAVVPRRRGGARVRAAGRRRARRGDRAGRRQRALRARARGACAGT